MSALGILRCVVGKYNGGQVGPVSLELGSEGDRVKVLATETNRVQKGFKASICS